MDHCVGTLAGGEGELLKVLSVDGKSRGPDIGV